jgi:hypothetical protein
MARCAQATAGPGAACTRPRTRPETIGRDATVVDQHGRALLHHRLRDPLAVDPRRLGVGRGLGVGQDQRRHPVGVPAQEGHRDVATHRQPTKHDPVELQPVEQLREVVRAHVERRVVLAQVGAAEAALVGRDDPADAAQGLALLEPHRGRQREGVQQDERLPASGLAEGQLHLRPPSVRRRRRSTGR